MDNYYRCQFNWDCYYKMHWNNMYLTKNFHRYSDHVYGSTDFNWTRTPYKITLGYIYTYLRLIHYRLGMFSLSTYFHMSNFIMAISEINIYMVTQLEADSECAWFPLACILHSPMKPNLYDHLGILTPKRWLLRNCKVTLLAVYL